MRRQAAKQRKKEEKVKQMEDLKRAKNLKKQEIFNKLKQIQEITGNKSMRARHLSHVNSIHIFKNSLLTMIFVSVHYCSLAVGFDEIDLETEFNPEEYDQKMENVFSNKYYEEDENAKPVFDDDIETAEYEHYDNNASADEAPDSDGEEQDHANEDEHVEENYEDDVYDGYNDEDYYDGGGEHYDNYGGEDGGNDDEEDIMMDADYLPGGELYGQNVGKKETKKERARREKEEKKAAKQKKGREDGIRTAVAAIEAARSTLDVDKEKKEFNSYLEDYYQLDYEDMVSRTMALSSLVRLAIPHNTNRPQSSHKRPSFISLATRFRLEIFPRVSNITKSSPPRLV